MTCLLTRKYFTQRYGITYSRPRNGIICSNYYTPVVLCNFRAIITSTIRLQGRDRETAISVNVSTPARRVFPSASVSGDDGMTKVSIN